MLVGCSLSKSKYGDDLLISESITSSAQENQEGVPKTGALREVISHSSLGLTDLKEQINKIYSNTLPDGISGIVIKGFSIRHEIYSRINNPAGVLDPETPALNQTYPMYSFKIFPPNNSTPIWLECYFLQTRIFPNLLSLPTTGKITPDCPPKSLFFLYSQGPVILAMLE